MNVYLTLFVGGLFLTIGDIVFKQYAHNLTWTPYLVGVVLYLAGLLLLIQTYKTENIAVATAIFIICNIVTLAIVSWLYFKEPITLLQGLGILLACGAVVLLR